MALASCEYGPRREPDYPFSGVDLATLEPMSVDVVYGNDVDRTVLHIPSALARLILVADSYGIDADYLVEAEAQDKEAGSSFEPYKVVQDRLKELYPNQWSDQFDTLRHDFRTDNRVPLLYDEAVPFLAGFEQRPEQPAIPSFFMTAAASRIWQKDKVVSTGARIHTEIIDAVCTLLPDGTVSTRTPPKVPTIDSWCEPDGSCRLVGVNANNEPIALVTAESFVLVDDKASSFKHMRQDRRPDGTYRHRGRLIRRPGEPLQQSQRGEVPPSVDTIASLGEISLQGIREADPAYFDHPLAADLTAFIPLARWVLAA